MQKLIEKTRRELPKNQRAIDAAKYSGDGMSAERIRIEDTDGLVLELSPTGKKVWRVYAQVGRGDTRKRLWTTLGPARSIPLGRAIDLAKAHVGKATDPEAAPSETFDELFRDHLEQFRKKERRSWESDEALYQRLIADVIGNTPINQLDKRALVAALSTIEGNSKRSQARLAHSLIGATFRWGIAVGRCFDNPAHGIPRRNALTHRDRKLTEAELRAIWHGSARMGRPQQIAVQLLLLLSLRRSEVIGMERAELETKPDHFSMRGERRKKWRIGKKPVAHVLPLPPLARSLIDEALSLARDSKYVFPNRTIAKDAPMSADNVTSAFARLMRTLNIEGARLHDLRSAAKTIMVDAGVPREYADAVQDHSGLGNAGDIYDRSEYLMHKRAALEVLEREVLRIVDNCYPSNGATDCLKRTSP